MYTQGLDYLHRISVVPHLSHRLNGHTCKLAFPPGKVMALGHRATAQWSRRWPWATSSSETVWHGHSSQEPLRQGQWQKTLPQRLESFVLAPLTSSTDLRRTMSLQIFHLKKEGSRDPQTPRPFQCFNEITCLPNGLLHTIATASNSHQPVFFEGER